MTNLSRASAAALLASPHGSIDPFPPQRDAATFAVGWDVAFAVLVFRFPQRLRRWRNEPVRRTFRKQCRRRFCQQKI
jgi:hypothetical protein